MVNISQKCGPGNLARCHRVYCGFPVVLAEYRLTISNGLKSRIICMYSAHSVAVQQEYTGH